MSANPAVLAEPKSGSKRRRLHSCSSEEARGSLAARSHASPDGSFVVTYRALAAEWGWSLYRVEKLLNALAASKEISRHVLPDNAGTRIRLLKRGGGTTGATATSIEEPAALHSLSVLADIETMSGRVSPALRDKLERAYTGIVYGEPGFEQGDVAHLELIEQALFGGAAVSLQRAA